MFNPYQAFIPLRAAAPIASAGAIAKTGINWAGLLSNTQKTLNIVNQAIPLVYQVKPIMNNAKTMLKVVNAFGNSKTNSPKIEQPTNNEIKNNNIDYSNENNGPMFFI